MNLARENRELKRLSKRNFSREDFFEFTRGDFKKIDSYPKRKHDYRSNSGSRYWYFNDYLIRESDHWGQVSTCFWTLEKENYYGRACLGKINFSEFSSIYIKNLLGGVRAGFRQQLAGKNCHGEYLDGTKNRLFFDRNKNLRKGVTYFRKKYKIDISQAAQRRFLKKIYPDFDFVKFNSAKFRKFWTTEKQESFIDYLEKDKREIEIRRNAWLNRKKWMIV